MRRKLFLAGFAEIRLRGVVAFEMPPMVLQVSVEVADFVDVLFARKNILRAPDAGVFLSCLWFRFLDQLVCHKSIAPPLVAGFCVRRKTTLLRSSLNHSLPQPSALRADKMPIVVHGALIEAQ
jgi:hypothetical protein